MSGEDLPHELRGRVQQGPLLDVDVDDEEMADQLDWLAGAIGEAVYLDDMDPAVIAKALVQAGAHLAVNHDDPDASIDSNFGHPEGDYGR